MDYILKAEHVSYTYQGKYQKVNALKDVSCTFDHGNFYAVVGRSEKGSGLGLSIVHQLVTKLNGTITADSVSGNGTIFTLLFPLTD